MSTCKKLLLQSVLWRWRSPSRRRKQPRRRREPRFGQVRRQRGYESAVVGLSPLRLWRAGDGPLARSRAGVVIGSIIANEAYRPRRGYYYDDYATTARTTTRRRTGRSAGNLCQNFRSFEWNTASIQPITAKALCPYLR